MKNFQNKEKNHESTYEHMKIKELFSKYMNIKNITCTHEKMKHSIIYL